MHVSRFLYGVCLAAIVTDSVRINCHTPVCGNHPENDKKGSANNGFHFHKGTNIINRVTNASFNRGSVL